MILQRRAAADDADGDDDALCDELAAISKSMLATNLDVCMRVALMVRWKKRWRRAMPTSNLESLARPLKGTQTGSQPRRPARQGYDSLSLTSDTLPRPLEVARLPTCLPGA